jgi:cytochrome d ubiquinol oxidase subunit II
MATVLQTIPLLFALVGLVLYTVLAGADFGAGLWQLLAEPGERGRRIRDFAHHANAPVWEANHVWLIFVITVVWTAYPVWFGSVASTLVIPLALAGLGIVFRGLTYALQSATEVPRERRAIDLTFAISSILTPYMLGAAVGGIASGRVPVGNAVGNLVTSWVNPTSILTGAMAVAVSAFLAAVYLAADAVRLRNTDLVRAFRIRALGAGVLSGALAIAGVFVLYDDARRIYNGLVSGYGLAALIVSAVGGLTTLALVWRSRFQLARGAAAIAVAAIVAGWAAAQRPFVLPGLTLRGASAGNDTMVAVIIAVVIGGAVLAPSLGLLFRLALTGEFDHAHPRQPGAARRQVRDSKRHPVRTARLAAGALVIGVVLLTIADAAVAHVFGVLALLTASVLTFTLVTPADLE